MAYFDEFLHVEFFTCCVYDNFFHCLIGLLLISFFYIYLLFGYEPKSRLQKAPLNLGVDRPVLLFVKVLGSPILIGCWVFRENPLSSDVDCK